MSNDPLMPNSNNSDPKGFIKLKEDASRIAGDADKITGVLEDKVVDMEYKINALYDKLFRLQKRRQNSQTSTHTTKKSNVSQLEDNLQEGKVTKQNEDLSNKISEQETKLPGYDKSHTELKDDQIKQPGTKDKEAGLPGYDKSQSGVKDDTNKEIPGKDKDSTKELQEPGKNKDNKEVPGKDKSKTDSSKADGELPDLEDLIVKTSGVKKDKWYDALKVFHSTYATYAKLLDQKVEKDHIYANIGKILEDLGVFDSHDLSISIKSSLFKKALGNIKIADKNNKNISEMVSQLAYIKVGETFLNKTDDIVKDAEYTGPMNAARKILAADGTKRLLASILLSHYDNNVDEVLKLSPEETYAQAVLAISGVHAKSSKIIQSTPLGKNLYNLLAYGNEATKAPAEPANKHLKAAVSA